MIYRERIVPSLGASLALLALVLASSFAIWAALSTIIAGSFALLALSFSLVWWMSAIHRIEFDGNWLRVNDAKLEIAHMKACTALDTQRWNRRRGVDFDPRLFQAHRFWMKAGIEITLDDPRDPHIGWLVASKDPDRLSALLSDAIDRKSV